MLRDDQLGLTLLLRIASSRWMNMTTSESCSMAPDSRRSDSCGRLSARASGLRLSCESAMTGTCELLREQLQRAADLGNLLLAVVRAPSQRAGHELEVVDDDELQALPARSHAPGLRADIDDVDVAGVDDVERHIVQDLRGLRRYGTSRRDRRACCGSDPTRRAPPSTAGACRSRSATSRGRTAPRDGARSPHCGRCSSRATTCRRPVAPRSRSGCRAAAPTSGRRGRGTRTAGPCMPCRGSGCSPGRPWPDRPGREGWRPRRASSRRATS